MNYPVWQLDAAGGGLLIAAIAVFHVYISHFAIGGGLFLVLTEIKAYREESPAILDYVHRHTKFFLLTTMVLGGMTGVGIWFTISLLTPAATSTLIHNFVFGWAIEWLFFVGEIVALFIYYNTFGTMNRRDHLRVGWLYFLFAWLSLFVINGIIGFMLTPGAWLTTGNFWDGFFNPTFWPALALRTTLCLMLAGLYGFVTASFLEDRELRERMVRYCALWLLAPFYFFLASAWWYSEALPGPLFDLIFRRAPELAPYLKTFFTVSPVLFAGGLLIAIRMPSMIKRTLAVAMLLLGITYMGSFEFIREGGRRPFIIRDHTYSTAITVADLPRVQAAGFLQTARWIKNRQVTAANRIAAGREVFNNLCLPCHSISGPMKDILPRTAKHTPMSLDAKLRGMGRADTYMPPFAGNDQDRRALIAFILEGLHHQAPAGEAEETTLAAAPEEQPLPFDPAKDEYVLLAWADSGMGEASDVDHLFGLLPAANRINAQLLRRGETPELLRDSVALSYKGGEGLAGRTGTLAATGRDSVFSADLANLSPYSTGNYQPYPVVTVEARDQKSGRLLAAVKTVVPVATELGCKNCHGGGWRLDNRTGIAEATGLAILAAHDRSSRTDLQARARGGKPASCRECHADPRFNAQGRTGVLNLSAAIHGFHAPFLEGFEGAAACHLCHATNPAGASRAFRGIHHEVGLDCVNCHGAMADHAVSLLRAEAEAGKKEAARLITHLAPQTSTSAAAIKPRQPWVNEPDCLACHEEFGPPAADNGFNRWNSNRRDLYRQRLDDSGSIRCAACHGSAHALLPATNPYDAHRDNLGPRQHQSTPYPMGADKNCRVCHTVAMDTEMHHPNSLRMMRTRR